MNRDLSTTQSKKKMALPIYMPDEVPVAHRPQPHAEQQADEGQDCQGLAEHLIFARRIRSSVVRSAL